MDDIDDFPEDHAYFEGPCTCTHEPEEHGYIGCEVDGCECNAHWEY
jgi:hypothetical protein